MRAVWHGGLSVTAALALIDSAVAAGPEVGFVHRHRTEVRLRCDIPPALYVSNPPMPPVMAVSQTAVLIRDPLPASPAPAMAAQVVSPRPFPPPPGPLPPGVLPPDLGPNTKVAYFQLQRGAIQINHCSVSRVVLIVRSDGYWSLSLRADQNPIAPPVPIPPPVRIVPGASPISTFTGFIKRNQFSLRLTGMTAFRIAEEPDSSPGKPVLFELLPPPFWVQRGVPYFTTFHGFDPLLANYFDEVDRVEVALSYR